ncbi:Beta-amylase [Durusdinium trenchii]|uniref:Beta-amylase n=2 Tax=Durusdinium trenchii TaxID=1381693 RepID=A0ABP0KA29_9DINO
MSNLISESSKESFGTWSSSSPIDSFLKLQHQWRPGWYFVVFVVNATATALLFPVDDPEDHLYQDQPISLQRSRWCFCLLMLASLGCGCAAAFLTKRAGASAHVRSASGHSISLWFESMLASMSLAPCGFRYGFIPVGNHHSWHMGFALCRGLLYLIGSFLLERLIASRMDLLEQASNQNYCSGCVRRLLWVQAWGAGVTSVFFFGMGIIYVVCGRIWDKLLCAALAIAMFTSLCKVVTSMVAAGSLARSFLHLRRVLYEAELEDVPAAAKSLRRARRFAALQAIGVSFSLVLTIVVVPFVLCENLGVMVDNDAVNAISLLQALDFLGHALAALLLSGSHRLPKVHQTSYQAGRQLSCWACPSQNRAAPEKETAWSPTWKAKIEELSLRGMTLRSLLHFYQEHLPSMPDWTYTPKHHKTRDVVRRVIIPLTSQEELAFAVSALNRDGAQRAQVMVTHNWGNSFKHMLAAVVSDALQECSFKMAAQLLEEDCAFLCGILAKSRRLDDTYWICAFAVNQHTSICHSNPYDRDPLTNELHPVCACSCVNISDADGRSSSSEINKFDDMMYHLATTGICRQVIAVDKSFELFRRAWCVAEIAEAKRLGMTQSLKLLSKATIQTLEVLDVRSMNASSEKDKELILGKIHNIDEFNAQLQALIFDPTSGLVASWNTMDSLQQVGEVGRLIRWGLADAGTGKVWNAWDADE